MRYAVTTLPFAMLRGPRGLVARLLRFPLFYKVLIANSLLVALGTVVGTLIALHVDALNGHTWPDVLLFTTIELALTIALNTLILRAALQPLRALRGTVDALGHGDFDVRVPQSPLADADLANVADRLNQVLDHLQRYQQRVQDLSASVLRAQEGERHRIARELHDQTGQALTLLLVRLKILEAAPQAEAVRPELADLRAAVAATIDQVRKLALDLRPPALDQLGLIPALRALTREFADQTRIAVTFEPPAAPIEPSPECAIAVYRIIQEALTNIAKHAEAHTVQVALVRADDGLHLLVADDGRGFDVAALRQRDGADGPGLGLFGMEERARLLGGSFTIESDLNSGTGPPGVVPPLAPGHPAGGTVILATLPLSPMEGPDGTLDPAPHAIPQPSHPHSAGG